MGGKGALNYLPIVPEAFVYVPKVMRKPVMGDRKLMPKGALSVPKTMSHGKI